MRRLSVLTALLGAMLATAIPAAGFHGEAVEGEWSTQDPVDGSRMVVTITEIDDDAGIFEVVLRDSNATVGCVPAAILEARASGEWFNNLVDPPMLFANFDVPGDVQCLGNSQLNPELGNLLHFEWFVMPDGTLHDGTGSVWGRVGRFSDDDFSIFESDIEWLAAQAITTGCNAEGTLFCPDGLVTRGQMAAFLARALSLPAAGAHPFTDTVGSIFEEDIAKVAEAGVTKGCDAEGTLFCPDDLVTRGQMAAFLSRALGLPDGAVNTFVDDDGSIFEVDIAKIAAAGITKGCTADGTKFCPGDQVTRGQMAAFLRRALE